MGILQNAEAPYMPTSEDEREFWQYGHAAPPPAEAPEPDVSGDLTAPVRAWRQMVGTVAEHAAGAARLTVRFQVGEVLATIAEEHAYLLGMALLRAIGMKVKVTG